ncbi:MAG: hypothetical protein Q4C98_07230 [Capnocytophaga sp.]|nr:hypothetical protein [Capnocytophaga sp.]
MKLTSLFFLSMLSISLSGQSKIRSAKENLSGSSEIMTQGEFSTEESSSNSSSPRYQLSDDSPLWGILFQLSLGLAYYAVFETPAEQQTPMYTAALNPYPFHRGAKGDYLYANQDDYVLWRVEGSNYYFPEKGRFYTNDLNVKFRIGNRFAVNTNYLHFWEKLLSGNENLDMISATAQYYRVRTQRIAFHWGIGASYIANDVKRWGFALDVGNEIFIKPFSIYTDFRGNFFRHSDILLFSIGPKFHYRNYHFGIKYQYINLARNKASGVSFGIGAMF